MPVLPRAARRVAIVVATVGGVAGTTLGALPAQAQDLPSVPGCVAVSVAGLPVAPPDLPGVPVGFGGNCEFVGTAGDQAAYVVLGGTGSLAGASSVVPAVGLPGLFDAGQGTCTDGLQQFSITANNDAGLAIGAAGCIPSAPSAPPLPGVPLPPLPGIPTPPLPI